MQMCDGASKQSKKECFRHSKISDSKLKYFFIIILWNIEYFFEERKNTYKKLVAKKTDANKFKA